MALPLACFGVLTALRSVIAAGSSLGPTHTTGRGDDAHVANSRVVLVRDVSVRIHGPLKDNDDVVKPRPVKGFVPTTHSKS